MKILLYTALLSFGCITKTHAQSNSLRDSILQIVKGIDGKIAVAIAGTDDTETVTLNANKRLPMMSVYKFPLALAVLKEVDKGKFSLDQDIFIAKKDLLPGTWSPLRDEYPRGDTNVPLRKIIKYTVSYGDNNGCDILFKLLGGTGYANKYIKRMGIKGMSIATTEAVMQNSWDAQYSNWSTAEAMLELLRKFYNKNMLSQPSYDLLWRLMVETPTGPNRIKGLLPVTSIVAHKTGSSNTNNQGVTAATNDIGIVKLPNGKSFAIVIFVSDSKEDEKTRELLIARIAKASWDHFSKKHE